MCNADAKVAKQEDGQVEGGLPREDSQPNVGQNERGL